MRQAAGGRVVRVVHTHGDYEGKGLVIPTVAMLQMSQHGYDYHIINFSVLAAGVNLRARPRLPPIR
jgi:hypothetical protein